MPDVVSPNTGRVIGAWTATPVDRIAATLDGLDRATRALAEPGARRALLEAIERAIVARKPALAALIAAEVGKPPAEAADEVDYAAGFIRWGAAAADHAAEASERPLGRRLRVVPAGPALLIAPWNDPLAGLTRKIAPALAAGCPVVVKPSALGQLTAAALFECIAATGFEGVVSLVNHDDRAVLARLVANPAFRVLSFTGSTETGLALTAQAGLKRLVMELGGDNPFLVLEGADLDRAAVDCAARKTRAAGQACSAQNRVYVVASLHAAFRERLFHQLEAVRYGPSSEAVHMGPVRTAGDVERLGRIAAAGGGVSLGRRDGEGGFLFPPTVIETDAPLRDAEAFGPVMSLTSAPDRAAAFARAAETRQALVCYVYGDAAEAELAPLRFGSIGLNTTRIQGADVPTGGFGTAGIGREGGLWGLREFLTTVNIREG